jgi:hypothetical protein
MGRTLTEQELQLEMLSLAGTGGVSANNRSSGFHPAFLDTCTHAACLSRFLDGQPATFNLFDGLPDELEGNRKPFGRVDAFRSGVLSGFVCEGQFYNRDEAARRVAGMH